MMDALSERGIPAQQVLAEIEALRRLDRPTHGGRLFAYVYDSGEPGLDELQHAAYAMSAAVNGLDPTAFPSLLAMENALVGAAARLLGGDADTVGSVTSGGTESLILAVKAARDAAPHIDAPRIAMASSAHAAFAKAGSYLRVALDVVPVDAATLRPEPAAMAAAIGPSTVLVVVSAPSYAHGVIDPVAPIAAAAAHRGVRCHVDACFGGWILPFRRQLGQPVPDFDLSTPGVTSLSVDLHKYAYTPKGVSVLLHKNAALRVSQYFAWAAWPGYTMINSTIQSTRSGGPIAAAYATLRRLGLDGYRQLTGQVVAACDGLAAAVRSVDGLRLMAEPESSVVCFTSTDPGLDLFVLADELAERGWHTQSQLAYADLPASIHLTVTASVAPRVDEFAAALRSAVASARDLGPASPTPHLLELLSSLTPDQVGPELVATMAAALGLGAGGDQPLPSRQADINALLNAAPPALRERLLVEFLSLLQRPS
jgi:glutamate/tyrosine decarboxylase-like PLP-dependent enzyme